ncbi:MAG TPA: hypothetical protein VK422_22540, partial [Pyrinomonadaceae bacterium]|nr:hypothetical protein [Pyrinomonadaceae bacterium]
TDAAEQAEDFGRRVGQSNTEAARTLAELIRLAEKAGQPEQVDLITRRFADLAAARGIPARELSTIAQQIAAGTSDEALNKLGLADPGKLYQDYAAAAGKTAESLSEVEKAQARLNPLLAQAAEAEGQAEDRLRSTAGQLDSTAAAQANLTAQIGESITTSIEFRDLLGTLSDALGSLVTSHAQARRELALGLKSPEQIAQEERDSTGRQIFNAFKGAATIPFAGAAALYDTYLGLTGQITREEAIARGDAYEEAVFNPGQRQYEARVEQLRALQEAIRRQGEEARSQAGAASARAAVAAERGALQARFASALEDATKEERLDARLGKLRELKDDLRELPGVLDASEAVKQAKKIDDAIRETSKQIAEAVRTARGAVRDFIGEAVSQSDRDNPFTALFVRARTEVEETRQKFRIFGADFAETMVQVKKASLDAETGVLRLQTGLQALRSEQEARRLDLPLVGLTGPQQRNLDVLAAQFAGLQQGGDLERRQRALEQPFRSPALLQLDAERQNRDLLNNLLALDVSGAGRGGREAQAAAVLNLLGQFDPRLVATSSLPFFRQLRAAGIDAYQVQRDALAENVRDAIERERAGNLIQTDARELLAAIRGSGADDAAKLREFLAVTSALSLNELTPDLRRARADFLRESSRADAEREQRGEARAQLLDSVLRKLDGLITAQGVKVDAPPSNVSFNLGDGLTVDRAQLGETPTAPVTPGFAPGFRE